MDIVIDPDVLRNAHNANGYGRTLSYVLNKAPYYRHVYTEELRAAYGRAEPTGQRTPQLVAANLAKQLYHKSGKDITIHRLIIVPFLSAEEVCGDDPDCRLTESDKQLVCVAKTIMEDSKPVQEAPKIVIVVDCPADSGERCLCQKAWTDQFSQDVQGVIICNAADRASLERWLHKDTTFANQQHQARFELVCGRWLDRKYTCQGKINFKYTKMSAGRKMEFEQDYFCQLQIAGLGHIYLGESKMLDGADQAQKLCEGLRQLERGIRDLAQSEPAPARVECYLFSNSSAFHDPRVTREAQQLACTYGVIVRFVYVTLPPRWKSQPNWLPEEKDFKEVYSFPMGTDS